MDQNDIPEGVLDCIVVLDHDAFLREKKGLKSDAISNIPTPCFSSIRAHPDCISLEAIIIDDDLIPEDKFGDFIYLLAFHEMKEVIFYAKNPEKLIEALKSVQTGQPISDEAHLCALKEEIKMAYKIGVSQEYQKYWEGFFDDAESKGVDEKTYKELENRRRIREEAFAEVGREIGFEINSELAKR